MSKLKRFAKRRKGLIIFLVIVLILGIIIFNIVSNFSNTVSAALSMPSISQLTQQDLSNVIMASGNTSAVDVRQVQAEISSAQSAYKIEQIAVEVGDTVKAGQVIATLDTTDAMDSVETAEEGVNDAYTGIVEANEQAQFDLGVAQRQLADAQNAYNIAKVNHEQKVGELTVELAAAQKDYNDAAALQKAIIDPLLLAYGALPTVNLTDVAAIEVRLIADYEALPPLEKQTPTTPDNTAIVDAYTNTILARETALEATLKVLQAAQIALDTQNSTYTTQERQNSLTIESATEQVERTQMNDQSVETAQTQLETAQTQLEAAHDSLNDHYIYAPIDGVVTQLNFSEGDTISGALCTVQDLSEMEISTTVASYDVIKLQKGMKATVTTDSTGDEELEGYIYSVSPIAVDTSGNFEVVVRLSESNSDLRAGVPSKITFLIEESKGVFAVPYDAIVEEGGNKYIYVYDERPTQEQLLLGEEDGRRKIIVTTGMETDYYVEVTNGELNDNMFLLDDPMGLNVATAQDMFMMIDAGAGGQAPQGGGGPGAAGGPGQ